MKKFINHLKDYLLLYFVILIFAILMVFIYNDKKDNKEYVFVPVFESTGAVCGHNVCFKSFEDYDKHVRFYHNSFNVKCEVLSLK
jgi:hypothetical protein